MARDAKLDAFGSTDDDTESTPAGEPEDGPADDPASGSEGAPADDPEDDPDVDPAADVEAMEDRPPAITPTSAWTPDGATCPACGERVERRWRQDGTLVCADCKDWSEP